MRPAKLRVFLLVLGVAVCCVLVGYYGGTTMEAARAQKATSAQTEADRLAPALDRIIEEQKKAVAAIEELGRVNKQADLNRLIEEQQQTGAALEELVRASNKPDVVAAEKAVREELNRLGKGDDEAILAPLKDTSLTAVFPRHTFFRVQSAKPAKDKACFLYGVDDRTGQVRGFRLRFRPQDLLNLFREDASPAGTRAKMESAVRAFLVLAEYHFDHDEPTDNYFSEVEFTKTEDGNTEAKAGLSAVGRHSCSKVFGTIHFDATGKVVDCRPWRFSGGDPYGEVPDRTEVAQAQERAAAHLKRLGAEGAEVTALLAAGESTLGLRAIPFSARFPRGDRKTSNVLLVSRWFDGQVVAVAKDAKELEAMFKDESVGLRGPGPERGVETWFLLSQELQQDGFYTFELVKDSVKVTKEDGRTTAAGRVIVKAGGTGELTATLSFDEKGQFMSAKEEVSIKPGERPKK